MTDDQKEYWHFINERHRITLKKEEGLRPPWTSDPILQNFKFTNVFREMDKTTIWLKENIRDKFTGGDLIFWLCLFRNTGTIDAGKELLLLGDVVTECLDKGSFIAAHLVNQQQQHDLKLFTGAYMVTCQYPDAKGKPKIISLLKHCLSHIHRDREMLYDYFMETQSLELAVKRLMAYNGFGGNGFMAYEVVSDLRHTAILRGASDIYTWANPGPGAQRGLSRYHGRYDPKTKNKQIKSREQTIYEMQELLKISDAFIGDHVPSLEMRDIEHSLCEYDKYMRVKTGEGRPRSKYNGGQQ